MKPIRKENEFDVIIVGGGITGVGTARDCALRGLKVLLLERFDFATGATGRNHGLLHSGARYAVTDEESATECIRENMILRRVARHCVEEHDGLFISLPEDDINYQTTFVEACRKAGIRADVIDPRQARIMEPSVNPALIGAVRVPDGSVDPFRLSTANVIDAREHGAVVKTYSEVVSLIRDGQRIIGVTVFNHYTHQTEEFYAPLTINAGGIWGHGIAAKVGIRVDMFPAKGSLLIFGHRVNNMVLNRCRKPANADILVPGDTVCVIGTTSSRVPFEECDHLSVTADEVDLLLSEGMKLAPELATTRILRAYAGVRPLVAADNDPSGRNISRGIVLMDHATRDGVEGFATITGGKLMTYRLMAEWATDLACRKLGVDKKCTTMTEPLPGSCEEEVKTTVRHHDMKPHVEASAFYRHGERAAKIDARNDLDTSLVCECEGVTVGEINYAVNELHVHSLVDLRKRTRLGMGTCQAEMCACRAAGIMGEALGCGHKAQDDLRSFLNERWKGVEPVAWGDTLRESEYSQWVYNAVCGME